MIIGIIVLVAVGALVWSHATTGSSLPIVGPKTTTVTGTFILTDTDTAHAACVGQGGYSDISSGVSVILTNQSGTILGSSILGDGIPDTSAGTCTYSFTIPAVPEDQDQYAIEVSHRGKVVESKAVLQADHWSFGLSIG